MATVTSAAVSIPSFTGLKAGGASSSSRISSVKVVSAVKLSSSSSSSSSVKCSIKEMGCGGALFVVGTAASAILASSAMAIDVKLGSDDGGLVFVPSDFSVASGEKIVFKNNSGFPHNVVFDEDEVPGGVDTSAISMKEEALLNGPGEEYSVTLTEKGTYTFYCSPHQGAGMVGKVTVN